MSRSDYKLYIETSGQLCSIALYDSSNLFSIRESERERSHASLITTFIQELMEEKNLAFSDLDAVVVSSGPGSYTGLRVGFSTAKGICYAHNIPLISVNTLDAMANGLRQKRNDNTALYCPIIDARRMEVYVALYDSDGKEEMSPSALILNDNFNYNLEKKSKNIVFGGSGVEKLQEHFPNDKFVYDTEFTSSATHLERSASHRFEKKLYENLAYSEPFYLKSVYIKK